MTVLAPTLQAFFTERLISSAPRQFPHRGGLSRHVPAAPRLPPTSAPARRRPPLDLDDLDAHMISGVPRPPRTANGATASPTRNARLAAIHSLFRYAALNHPEHAEVIHRVLAIPPKRADRPEVSYLDPVEVDALLAAPDRNRWVGRRDHALLLVAIQTGLRVSELTGLRRGDVQLGAGAHLRCHGKGRKDRPPRSPPEPSPCCVPGSPSNPTHRTPRCSPPAAGDRSAATPSHCSLPGTPDWPPPPARSLATKTVTPHVLRHTAAMRLLHAGVDTATIALWLGHERVDTTMTYVHADLAIKERALARTTPPGVPTRRYRPSDKLLAFLAGL